MIILFFVNELDMVHNGHNIGVEKGKTENSGADQNREKLEQNLDRPSLVPSHLCF